MLNQVGNKYIEIHSIAHGNKIVLHIYDIVTHSKNYGGGNAEMMRNKDTLGIFVPLRILYVWIIAFLYCPHGDHHTLTRIIVLSLYIVLAPS